MIEILQMVGLLMAVLSGSMVLSYFLTRHNRKQLAIVPLEENTRVRMVGPGGSYRCYFLRRSKKGLTFSAPLQRDRYIPVRVGESMMVQAPLADCLVTFKSTVESRDAETHEFILAWPKRVRMVDRRAENREATREGSIILVNGEPASVLNLSAGGARLVTAAKIQPGDTLSLELNQDFGMVYGWALEVLPSLSGGAAWEVRVRFEEPLAGFTGIRRRQLYLGR
jgi:hypothetical protein